MMTTTVTTGREQARTRIHHRPATKQTETATQIDHPVCIDGMAAYWLETSSLAGVWSLPHVLYLMNVSTKPPSGTRRGGAKGYSH